MIFIVEATLTSVTRSRKAITSIMRRVVTMMLECGVPNRGLTFPRNPGISPSRLMAIGVREAERMPAFPVVMNARSAATARMMTP